MDENQRWQSLELDASMQSDDFNLLRSVESDNGMLVDQVAGPSSSVGKNWQLPANSAQKVPDNILATVEKKDGDGNEPSSDQEIPGPSSQFGMLQQFAEKNYHRARAIRGQRQIIDRRFKIRSSDKQDSEESEDSSSGSDTSNGNNVVFGQEQVLLNYPKGENSDSLFEGIINPNGGVEGSSLPQPTENNHGQDLGIFLPEFSSNPFLIDNVPIEPENSADSGGESYIQMFMKIMQERFCLVNQYCDTSKEPLTFNRENKMQYEGTDCLDYVVAYGTKGIPEDNVPDHWHYVSFGLSDTRGNGIKFPHLVDNTTDKSGAGYELTFRVRAPLNEHPPAWPVELLHSVARYIYNSKSLLAPGDHISWFNPINNVPGCILKNLFVIIDPTIPMLETMTGAVTHYQIVGATNEELHEAQRWNTLSLLSIFERDISLGGKYLVTDIDRKQSVQTIVPGANNLSDQGMLRDGSDLTGVSCRLIWTFPPWTLLNTEKFWVMSELERKNYAEFFEVATIPDETQVEDLLKLFNCASICQEEDENSEKANADFEAQNAQNVEGGNNNNGERAETENAGSDEDDEEEDLITLRKLHVTMNFDASLMLPTAFMGRVNHNRHFTFNDVMFKDAVTFVSPGMAGAYTSDERPFVSCGPWIHVQLPEAARSKILADLQPMFNATSEQIFPKFFSWPEYNFAITVVDQSCF